jgi:hypothetical protein
MTDFINDLNRLLEEGQALGYGPAQVALFEEAVRLADTHGDVQQGYGARIKLIEAAAFGGRDDLLLVAFSWCLAQHDRDPERFDEWELLWRYKWVVTCLPGFPQVSRQQIMAMWADMGQRFKRAGSTLHAVYHKKRDVLWDMGDKAGALRADKQMAKRPRDWLSDCPACVADQAVDHLILLGHNEPAIARATPILAGRLTCAEIPHRTYARVLLPLLRLGRAEEAMAYHRKGYRLIAAKPDFIRSVAEHLSFLTLTDNLPKAVKILEKHLPEALTASNYTHRFEFYLASLLLLGCLTDQGKQILSLRLPATFPLHEVKGRYAVTALSAWFGDQLRDLAERFDARNGNKYYSRRVRDLKKLEKLFTPCPLSPHGPS